MYVDLMWSLFLTLTGVSIYFQWSTTVIVCTSQRGITLKFSLWSTRLKLYLTHLLCKEEVEHRSGNKLHVTMVIRHRERPSLTKLASGLHQVHGFNLKVEASFLYKDRVLVTTLSCDLNLQRHLTIIDAIGGMQFICMLFLDLGSLLHSWPIIACNKSP